MPDNRPILSAGASDGISELWKTIANSEPMTAIATPATAIAIDDCPPGVANHKSDAPMTSSKPKVAIHGFLRPPASEIAPIAGEAIATTKPALPSARPQIVCPLAGPGASTDAKNGAKI